MSVPLSKQPGAAPPAGPPDPGAAVCARGLRKVYRGGTAAVDSLDLAVRPGEVFALPGPNGAGKSTTVGMLTTGVVPTGGRAWVAGVDVVSQPARARRGIGVVPQRNTLDRVLTVRENLVFHGRFFGMPARSARREADLRLDQVALAHVSGKAAGELSGGMAQRLMIARAILHRPAVLFLDEPTAGLDPQSRRALHDLVRDLRSGGQTTVLITHDMQEADQLADRLAIIDHGRLLALDTPANLKASSQAAITVTLAADTAPDRLAAVMRERLPGVREARPRAGDVLLSVHADRRAVFPAVAAAAAGAGVSLRDVRVEEPSLETVFIRLTGKELRDQ